MAKSHAITGLAAWVVVAPLLHLHALDPAGLSLVLVGSLVPDIDHPASAVGRRCWPVSAVISGAFGHRGITHSAVAVAAAVALLARNGWSRAGTAAFAIGYLSHLAADMLSPRGLRLAWPLKGTWSLPVYSTGKMSEAVVVAGLCVLAGWVALRGMDAHGVPHALRTWLDQVLLPTARPGARG